MPVNPSNKQEKILAIVCVVVSLIMLLSLSRYLFS